MKTGERDFSMEEKTLRLIAKAGAWNLHRLPLGRALICSICQLQRCKYSHHGCFEVNGIRPLNAELERGASSQHTVCESPSELGTVKSI